MRRVLTGLIVLVLIGANPTDAQQQGTGNRPRSQEKRAANRQAQMPAPQGHGSGDAGEQGAVKTVQLRLSLPGPAAKQGMRMRLLRDANDLKPGDAYRLYDQAIALLPENPNRWDQVTVDQITQGEAKAYIQEMTPLIEVLARASMVRDCNWPASQPGSAGQDVLSLYRKLSYVVASQARCQMAIRDFQGAVNTLAVGMAMAKHLGQAPTIIHGLVGVAIGTVMCKQVEEFEQQPGAPSLYEAIKALPVPLVDVERQIQAELGNLDKDPRVNWLNRSAFKGVLDPAHERVRVIGKRLERHIAALQCIEAIRIYAAAHGGKLPGNLDQVKDVQIPNDPTTEKPFVYRMEADKAILESPPPKGGDPKEALRYELTLTKDR